MLTFFFGKFSEHRREEQRTENIRTKVIIVISVSHKQEPLKWSWEML